MTRRCGSGCGCSRGSKGSGGSGGIGGSGGSGVIDGSGGGSGLFLLSFLSASARVVDVPIKNQMRYSTSVTSSSSYSSFSFALTVTSSHRNLLRSPQIV